jgi:hypothetical protein
MPVPKPQPTKDELISLYVEQKISPEEIGRRFSLHGKTVRTIMDKFGIERLGPAHLRKGVSATWNVGLKHSEETIQKNRMSHIGMTPHNKGQGDISFLCEVCGKHVIAKPYRKKRTCSKQCKDKLSAIYRGASHWNYKGENATSKKRIRMWSEYKEWRNNVIKNFGHKCQKCGSTKRITAHHIYTWNTHPELCFDVSNGACLCHKCHLAFHREYGFHKTTAAMFNHWMSPCT